MTRAEYMACLRMLRDELREAEDSGDRSRLLGTVMALETFLRVVQPPVADNKPATA
jgi:hypothetical protein